MTTSPVASIRATCGVLLLLGTAACGSTPTDTVGPPSEIAFVGGGGQAGTVGALVALNPGVRVTDANGNALAGIAIFFDVVSGGGTITGDSTVTDASGLATVGSWRLGPTPGVHTLRAQAVGLPLLATVNVTASAGAPSSLQVVEGGSGLSALVGQPVGTNPVVRVRDAFGNPVPGSSVTWQVVAGGGSITGSATTTTNAEGRATVGGWTLGPAQGVNSLQARTSNGIVATISATGIGIPAGFEPASPLSQDGVSNFQVEKIPRVRVFDAQNVPVAGVPVLFTLVGGSGTLTGTAAVSDENGIAAPGDWKVGAAGTSTVQASVPGLSVPPVVFTATGTPQAFVIDLRFVGIAPPDLRDDFVEGTLRWMELIVGDLGDFNPQLATNGCGLYSHEGINQAVDDLVVFAAIVPIDGPGNILGQAGPCRIRPANGQTAVGIMQFDIQDADLYHSTGRFSSIVIHELGHVLGMTENSWSARGLNQGNGTQDPIYIGAQGVAGWNTLGIAYSGTPVPVEATGGQGTALSHWRESVLDNEIMTGFIEGAGISMPLTRLTAGALIDLGYVVDLTKADPYLPPLLADALRANEKIRINEVILSPPRF
ncbi:MAG: Ig-like domain-containing protein [Gemmatimonadales bacterium]